MTTELRERLARRLYHGQDTDIVQLRQHEPMSMTDCLDAIDTLLAELDAAGPAMAAPITEAIAAAVAEEREAWKPLLDFAIDLHRRERLRGVGETASDATHIQLGAILEAIRVRGNQDG